MKYVITGSLGHISQPVVTALVAAGHDVTVVTSSEDRAKQIRALGATPAIGSVKDQAFITKAFSGANVAYTMVPPVWDVQDWKSYIGSIGKIYAEAIRVNHIKYVVNLSSMGAHMADGAGPISGLHRAEAALNELSGVNIKHLRPTYFYWNLLSNINLIKNAGIMGSNFGFTDKKFTLVHTDDIARIATALLLKPDFEGHSVEYIVSDEVSTDDIAAAFGKAIDMPGLKWVTFTDEQALQGGIQAGLKEEISKNYAEMGHAIQTGEMAADYWKQHPPVAGKIKLDEFAKTFAAIFTADKQPAAAH